MGKIIKLQLEELPTLCVVGKQLKGTEKGTGTCLLNFFNSELLALITLTSYPF